MRFHARTAVGSPALRLTVLTALLCAVLAAAGGLVAGAASLLPSPQVDIGPETPTWQPLEPTAVFDVPNAHGVISLATDGSTVWAAGAFQLLSIDSTTNTAELMDAPVAADDTALLSADDGLWATRYMGGRVYRLDPATGAVELEVVLAGATNPRLDGAELWVERGNTHDMVQVDRVTGALGDRRPGGVYTASGPDGPASRWSKVPGVPPMVERIDAASGETLATIELPAAPECASPGFAGSYPESFVYGCFFAGDVTDRPYAWIDPATNSITATTVLPATHGAAPVVLDGQTWLVGSFEDPEGAPFGGMVRVDPASGEMQRWISFGDVDPDPPVAADGAIWVGDDGGQRVLRFDP
jgi:hypothetical protein